MHALFLCLKEEVGVDLVHGGVVTHASLVDEDLGLVHVLLVAVEPVDAGLQGLLADELLHDKVIFVHGVLQLAAKGLLVVEDVTGCGGAPIGEGLDDVLGRHNSINRSILSSFRLKGCRLWRLTHVLIDELSHIDNI